MFILHIKHYMSIHSKILKLTSEYQSRITCQIHGYKKIIASNVQFSFTSFCQKYREGTKTWIK